MTAASGDRSIEEEIKLEIPDRATFDSLHESLSLASSTPPARLEQVNHYFDTRELLLTRSGIMLRLRVTDGRPELTLKIGGELEEGHFRARELEETVSPARAAELLEQPARVHDLDLEPVRILREELGAPPLEVIGELRNERTVFTVDGYLVELDRMRFGDGGEEYEMEVESGRPAAARAWCTRWLEAAGIRVTLSRETKSQRLLRRAGLLKSPGG